MEEIKNVKDADDVYEYKKQTRILEQNLDNLNNLLATIDEVKEIIASDYQEMQPLLLKILTMNMNSAEKLQSALNDLEVLKSVNLELNEQTKEVYNFLTEFYRKQNGLRSDSYKSDNNEEPNA